MKARILLIEDNPQNRYLATFMLEQRGHRVTQAETGPQGLALAAKVRPDLILLDIQLPGMDGYEVAKAFRADPSLRGVYLVALSGYAQPKDLERASEAGFDKHVAKPASLDTLEVLLAQAPLSLPS